MVKKHVLLFRWCLHRRFIPAMKKTTKTFKKRLVIFQTRAFEINDRNGSHYSKIRIALFLENLPKKIGVIATGAAGENADNVTKIKSYKKRIKTGWKESEDEWIRRSK